MAVTLSNILDYLSYLPKYLTEKTVMLLNNWGLKTSNRWVGLLYFFISVSLILVGMKISKPLIKFLLIIIGIVLLIGVILPFW